MHIGREENVQGPQTAVTAAVGAEGFLDES